VKILILSSRDISGGAAIASYRLHKSLLSQKIDSKMLVQHKSSDDFLVLTNNKKNIKLFNLFRPSIDNLFLKFYENRENALFSISWLGFENIAEKINEINPDIVHLHWISGAMIRIEKLSKIKAPIVWTLHDMWPFTGGCHYDLHCGLYKKKCGNCKVLNSNKSNDISRKGFNRRVNTYSKIKNMNIVATSSWIGRCAKESFLFKDREIDVIPNPINTELFSPINKNIARNLFNIPKDKTVIMFSALGAMNDPRKGSKQLFDAINMLNLENIVFVIVGKGPSDETQRLKHPSYFIPPLSDETSMSLLYNTADIMVAPSLQENLANSIIESLLCGVPVVAFDIGGNSDMIKHKVNGYLAETVSPKNLAHGIEWVFKNQKVSNLSGNARNLATKFSDQKIVSKRYISLYKKILDK
jgi:glycosyltransferase involved in cell wall biosynthesis